MLNMSNPPTNIYWTPMIILTLGVMIVALAVKYVDYRFNEFKSSVASTDIPATPQYRALSPEELDEINRVMEGQRVVKPPATPEELAHIKAVMEENSKDIPPLTDARRAEIERAYQNNFTTP